MEYECKRCGFNTEHKHVIIRHLQRKIQCKALKQEINTSELLKDFIKDKDTKFVCKHCGKKFAHASSLSRHHKACTKNTEVELKMKSRR